MWQGAWTAWGQPNGATGAAPVYGWHGQTGAYLEGESGLLKMGARYYAPCLGRFLTRDPSGFAAGANLYSFCLDDPVNFFDPNGCTPVDWGQLLRKIGPPGLNLGDYLDDLSDPMGALNRHNPLKALLDLPGAATDAGTAQGRYDSGKISGMELALAYGNYGMKLANAAMMIYGTGKALGALAEAEAAVGACKNGTCFVAGTPVWVASQDAHGQWHICSKPIEQVKAGEYVIAKNESTGKTEYKRVTWTRTRTSDAVLRISLQDAKSGQIVETITASREHPFYVEGKGFVVAGGLAVGNSIVTRAGPALVIQSIDWQRRPEGYTVYNFEVEDDHSYFVGTANGGAWVHNYDELGDLTTAEAEKLQSFADEHQTPIYIGGSAAKGARRGLGTDLPLGKGPGTRSDLDIGVPRAGRYPDLERAIHDSFGNDIDSHGILSGPYAFDEPIIFRPKTR